jgi:hypothetical protein
MLIAGPGLFGLRASNAAAGVSAESLGVSHVSAAISCLADSFVFYGGTALCRTVLRSLRLSEDVDLLSVGARSSVAPRLDQAIRDYMEPLFGSVRAEPWLSAAVRDTQGCAFRIGRVSVRIQLMDGRSYADWPTRDCEIE